MRLETDLSGFTDEQLIMTIQASESADEHFTEVFRRYSQRVRTWCERFTGDSELALDLAQDVFLKAFRHLDSFRCDSRFSTWLFAVTQNHCRNFNSRRRLAPLEMDQSVAEGVADDNALEPYEAVERKQMYAMMWNLISTTLDPIEARIMSLHYGEEVPLATITRQLSLSNRSGAKAYIVSARRKLNGAIRRNAERAAC